MTTLKNSSLGMKLVIAFLAMLVLGILLVVGRFFYLKNSFFIASQDDPPEAIALSFTDFLVAGKYEDARSYEDLAWGPENIEDLRSATGIKDSCKLPSKDVDALHAELINGEYEVPIELKCDGENKTFIVHVSEEKPHLVKRVKH